MRYNDLPVHTGFAMTAQEVRENHDTYERLREVCTRGKAPCGGKTVVHELPTISRTRRFSVVCNPRNLDTAHIAAFCARGDLLFGFGVSGSIIEIYAD